MSTHKKLERVQLTDTKIKMVMPQKVLNQIQWLCKEIPKVEWSGVLFYSIEGSIKDPENMVITLQEILPMHKGTSGYTEYTFDERVLDFMMDNPETENWKMGHIHSHNTMAVFFSGTDWSELEDNAPNHNFYVSLIVNNFMDFCAKTCFIAETETASLIAKDENGSKYTYLEQAPTKQEKLIVYDCEIFSPKNEIEVSEDFASKVKGIIEKAEKVASQRVTTWPGRGATTIKTSPNNSWSRTGKSNGWDDWDQPLFSVNTQQDELEDEVIEEFTKYVVNTGNSVEKYRNMEEILEMYKTFGVNPQMLAKGVLENYTIVYNKFFDKYTDKDNPKMFAEVTEKVIEELETEKEVTTYSLYSRMLKETISSLKKMLHEFNKYEFSTSK